MRTLAIITVALILGGCTQTIDQLADNCQAIGYQPGSDAHTYCVHSAYVQERQLEARRRAIGAAIASQGLSDASRAYRPAPVVIID